MERQLFSSILPSFHTSNHLANGCKVGIITASEWFSMYRLWLFFMILVALVFLLGCGDVQVDTKEQKPETGAIRGFISPITAKDAVVGVYRDGIFIASAKVNDTGRYTLEGLPEGEYDLSITAEGYLMDSPIRGIRVRAGQMTDVGRTVLTLIPPDRQSDQRPQDADVDVFTLRVEGMF